MADQMSISEFSLPTFTFRQVGVRPIEFQGLPGQEAGALRGKTMRRIPFLGPGGQIVLSVRTGLFGCRGALLGARWARLTKLRIVDCGMRIDKEKPKKSEIRNPKSEITGPMLFPRNALASWPQDCLLAENEIIKVKEARRILLAHFLFSVHVGVRAGGIWIIRLGGITPFEQPSRLTSAKRGQRRNSYWGTNAQNYFTFPISSRQARPNGRTTASG
jgi:hypothetical protein